MVDIVILDDRLIELDEVTMEDEDRKDDTFVVIVAVLDNEIIDPVCVTVELLLPLSDRVTDCDPDADTDVQADTDADADLDIDAERDADLLADTVEVCVKRNDIVADRDRGTLE